jgi:hypothetical protein
MVDDGDESGAVACGCEVLSDAETLRWAAGMPEGEVDYGDCNGGGGGGLGEGKGAHFDGWMD